LKFKITIAAFAYKLRRMSSSFTQAKIVMPIRWAKNVRYYFSIHKRTLWWVQCNKNEPTDGWKTYFFD